MICTLNPKSFKKFNNLRMCLTPFDTIKFSPLAALIFYENNIQGVDPGVLTGSTLPLGKAAQSRWYILHLLSEPIHLPPTHWATPFAFLEEGVFLAK